MFSLVTFLQKKRGCYVKKFRSNSLNIIVISILCTISSISCSGEWLWGKGDVNLSKATWLAAREIPLITDKGGIPGGGPTVTPVDNLFKLAPGTKVNVAALGGTIDPTGTNIVNDFDGDGILNVNETTTNVWVADFPQVESVIATPITMQVAVEMTDHSSESEISSEINSNDISSGKTEGSEKIHQNELALKTVQFQDQYSVSTENSGSLGVSFSMGQNAGVSDSKEGDSHGGSNPSLASAGFNYGVSVSGSWDNKHSLSTTTTKWADRPFKNNIDSAAQNLKANSASQKARQFRTEKATKSEQGLKTKSNGGYVRAALYIKNNSVNMPVKLSHILCSLMFEAPNGDLIPVRSFELYKADGSNFEVEVYGGTEFGPYVVENIGLNGFEVERAIASGYNPKIYIVDYVMTHVADSNYKSSLLNFSGDNLKIIEENSKGRTALVKIIGPSIRDMHRVAAFDAIGENNTDPCDLNIATQMSPGISLENALKRIGCSGTEIEFGNYVLDFSEIAPTLNEPKLFMRGIKSIGGIRNTIPCVDTPSVGSDGQLRTACVQKPISQWTEAEFNTAGVWAVYSKGKYYSPLSFYMDGTGSTATQRKFNSDSSLPAFMVLGVDANIWAGDIYDIVYISAKDLLLKQKQFGTNPLETLATYKVNTSWDSETTGKNPYYPETQSLFLGDAGFGEKIQLKIKLDKTRYLNPNFGTSQTVGNQQYFTNFTYNNQLVNKKFEYNQFPDFEISLGFGGERTDWLHIVKDLGTSAEDMKPKNCGTSIDFDNQVYNACIELPKTHPYVDPNVGIIKVYIRPALNTAYRRVAWPLRALDVRKVQGPLFSQAVEGDQSILISKDYTVKEGFAGFDTNDTIKIFGDPNSYVVSSAVEQLCELGTVNLSVCYKLNLTTPIKIVSNRFNYVYSMVGINNPSMRFVVESGFYTDWNSQYGTYPSYADWDLSKKVSLLNGNGTVNCSSNLFHPTCLGINTDFTPVNWIGAYNQGVAKWNSWADAGYFSKFLDNGVPKQTSQSGKSFGLEVANTPFQISTFYSSNVPQVVSYGDVALAVWNQTEEGVFYTIYGQYFNLSTGLPLQNKFIINTSPNPDIPKVKIKGSKAVIAWTNGDRNTGYIRAYNLITKAAETSEISFPIPRPFPCDQFCTLLFVSTHLEIVGNRILFFYARNWNLSGAPTSDMKYRITGTSVRLDTWQVESNDFLVMQSYFGTGSGTITATEGNRILLSSVIQYPGGGSTGKAINYGLFSTDSLGLVASGDLQEGNVLPTYVAFANGKGIITYSAGIAGNKLQTLNAETGALLSNSSIPKLPYYANCARINNSLACTDSTDNISNVKLIDLETGQYLNKNYILLDNSGAFSGSFSPPVLLNDGVVLFISNEYIPAAGKYFITGRRVNIPLETVIDKVSFRLYEGTISIDALNSYVTYGPMGFWVGGDFDNHSIVGLYLNINTPNRPRFGLNNFFIAPLIDRDYTIQAQISF